jgi:hypothetical protein
MEETVLCVNCNELLDKKKFHHATLKSSSKPNICKKCMKDKKTKIEEESKGKDLSKPKDETLKLEEELSKPKEETKPEEEMKNIDKKREMRIKQLSKMQNPFKQKYLDLKTHVCGNCNTQIINGGFSQEILTFYCNSSIANDNSIYKFQNIVYKCGTCNDILLITPDIILGKVVHDNSIII